MTTLLENAPKISPMMAQWHECKVQAKEALVFFRLGDFYEAFYQDALLVAKELDLTLTKRQEIPMCGVPYHAVEAHLEKLVSLGYSVAIVEQVTPPNAKGIIDRKISRIISPGTMMSASLLQESSSKYIASAFHLNQRYGLAFLEISTGEFSLVEFDAEAPFFDELFSFFPKELLISAKLFKHHQAILENYCKDSLCKLQIKEDWYFEHHSCLKNILDHFGVHNLDAFGLQREIAAINAAGALLCYIKKELRQETQHIQTLFKIQPSDSLKIDRTTLSHLELLESQNENDHFTLLSHLDETLTPMGYRLLSKWIRHPLISQDEIIRRQEAIGETLTNLDSLQKLQLNLQKIHDLERLISRIASKLSGPRDLYQLGSSLFCIPQIKATLSKLSSPLWKSLQEQLGDFSDLYQEILAALNPEAPLRVSDGNVFKASYHPVLEELRSLKEGSDRWLLEYQERLRKEMDIKTLKVGYSRAFGYFIEVSRAQSEKMPSSFQRRQTLVNGERFLSKELYEFECKVLSADEQLSKLEKELFEQLEQKVLSVIGAIQATSRSLAQIDVLQSLATIAKTYGYSRPIITNENILEFEEGKHPLVSAKLGSNYIPSNLVMNSQDLIHLITGPNMGGKSTFLRTTALLVILAQMGSYIPAKKALIGLRDQLFTRIGASDDLARGRSTFLVEMSETAQILRSATERSLVILDEVGRGTSTYDGLSIAWAVTEYLHQRKIPTLFATHYFELTALEEKFPSIKNFHVSALERGSDLIFLHRIEKGAADKSYGIQVAKMAGIPLEIVRSAQELLQKFQKSGLSTKKSKEKMRQMSLFGQDPIEDSKGDLLLEELRKLKVEELSPLEAFEKLIAWKAHFHV